MKKIITLIMAETERKEHFINFIINKFKIFAIGVLFLSLFILTTSLFLLISYIGYSLIKTPLTIIILFMIASYFIGKTMRSMKY
jgi:hypothetical protein